MQPKLNWNSVYEEHMCTDVYILMYVYAAIHFSTLFVHTIFHTMLFLMVQLFACLKLST